MSPHAGPTGVGHETRLRAYLRRTGTPVSWLAQQIHVSSSTVSRWAHGQEPMAEHYRQAILSALQDRAKIPLDGLLDDQLESRPLGGDAHLYPTRAAQLAARRSE